MNTNEVTSEERALFYTNGLTKISLAQDKLYLLLLKKCSDMLAGNLPKPFELVTKYDGTKDLRPSAMSYAPELVDYFVQSGIALKLNMLTCQRLLLSHIQLRIALPGRNSYMDWHRDSYQFGRGSAVGNFPPVYKLIIYPKFDGDHTPTLLIKRGSSLVFFGSKLIDYAFARAPWATEEIYPSNDSAVFFNSFSLHKALSPSASAAQVRIIYTLSAEFQDDDGLDQPLKHIYMSKYNESGFNLS